MSPDFESFPPIYVATDVEKDASFPRAAASSLSVFNASGAEATTAAAAVVAALSA